MHRINLVETNFPKRDARQVGCRLLPLCLCCWWRWLWWWDREDQILCGCVRLPLLSVFFGVGGLCCFWILEFLFLDLVGGTGRDECWMEGCEGVNRGWRLILTCYLVRCGCLMSVCPWFVDDNRQLQVLGLGLDWFDTSNTQLSTAGNNFKYNTQYTIQTHNT